MNSPPATHPTTEELQAFCLGRLAEKQVLAIHAHLESCPVCMEKAAKVHADTFLRNLRAGGKPNAPALESTPQMSTQASIGMQGSPAPADTAAFEPSKQPTVPGAPTIPGLEVEKLLGRGGMGVVYLVRQTALKRLAALKLIRKGDDAGVTDLARFKMEAETIARLQHDNIVQIYQVAAEGETPFLLLEYVEGGTLAQKLAASPLPCRQAAAITLTLTHAVQFAHEKGVIHRDLKPANILLNQFGKPKINDFGLAKQVDFHNVTQTKAVLGTPSYMAPEQAAGKSRDITAAADVYSLGAILYEMVVGRPPFKGESPLVTIRQVLGQEPVPPRRLQPEVPADLEAVILKCLEKDPTRRYSSAKALGDDIRRYLANEPVQARPAAWHDRSRRWVKRRPALTALIGVSVVAVIFLFFALAGWMYSGRLESALAESARQRTVAEEEREYAKNQKARASYMAGLFAAQQSMELGTASFIFDFLDRTKPAAGEADVRGFEWYHLWRLCHRSTKTLREHAAPVMCIALSPDDATLASASRAGVVKIWNFAARSERHTIKAHRDAVVALAIAPDGKTLASAGLDGLVKLWNTDTGTEIKAFPNHEGGASACVFDPKGKWLVTGSMNGTLRLWPLDDPRAPPRTLAKLTSQITCLAVTAGGDFLAASGGDPVIHVWQMPTGKELAPLEAHKSTVQSLAFSQEAGFLASGSEDGEMHLWDLENEAIHKTFNLHRAPVSSLVFSKKGDALISGSLDHSVRIWKVGKKGWGQNCFAVEHTGKVSGVALSGDGKQLVTGSYDRTLKFWDVDQVQEPRLLGAHKGEVASIAFADDGAMYSVGAENLVAERRGDQNNFHLVKYNSIVTAQAMVMRRSDSMMFVAGVKTPGATSPGEIHTFQPGRWFQDLLGEHRAPVTSLALSSDGALLASASLDRTVKLWDTLGRRELATLAGHTGAVNAVALSPDGKSLASGGAGNQIFLWDVESRKTRMELKGYEGAVNCLAFSPDGKFLVIGGENLTTHQCPLVVWDLEANRPLTLLKGHTNMVNALTFSPNGKQLATGSHDQTVKLWDWASREERATYKEHLAPVKALAFSLDGRTLVSGDQDGTAIVRRGASDAEAKGRP